MFTDENMSLFGWKFLKELLSTLTHASCQVSTLESIRYVFQIMMEKFPSELKKQEKLLFRMAHDIFDCIPKQVKPPAFAYHDKKVNNVTFHTM